MNVLNSAVRHATDGFIGILDMFGFEDAKVNLFQVTYQMNNIFICFKAESFGAVVHQFMR